MGNCASEAFTGVQPTSAESVEERGLTNENIEQLLLGRTPSRNRDGQPAQARSRGLLGVREAASKDKKLQFTNLLHHVSPELLKTSFFDLKKDAAPGIDGETWHEYATGGACTEFCVSQLFCVN